MDFERIFQHSAQVDGVAGGRRHPMPDRLRIMSMYRRTARPTTVYLLSDRLHEGHTAHVGTHEIATTVAAWLAELGARSPLVDDLAHAVRTGDWASVRRLGDYLSVEVSVAAT
jgi:LmbE family N-acetylglucosaminyl deacetylase